MDSSPKTLPRTDLLVLLAIRLHTGEPTVGPTLDTLTPHVPDLDEAIARLRDLGLAVGGDDPDHPLAITLEGLDALAPARAAHGCSCPDSRHMGEVICGRRFPHNRGWCGDCGHHASCHNRQPTAAELALMMPPDPPPIAHDPPVPLARNPLAPSGILFF